MRNNLFQHYDPGQFFCELFGTKDHPASHNKRLISRISRLNLNTLKRKSRAIEAELFNLGITFTVYSDRDRIDRILPFDALPRTISSAQWQHLERGCIQRVCALNLFIHDIYHEQKILRDKIIPAELVLKNANYRKQMAGFEPPGGAYVHIAGVDLVRDNNGEFLVLEDNARTPSGVSYVIENRHLMHRTFPELMAGLNVLPVSDYGSRLRNSLNQVSPTAAGDARVVLLSPGVFNSAYFEHVFLAREMGAPLVEGRDLVVQDKKVFMQTTGGLKRVDVIYRRIDDDFLDPAHFNKDSLLGVPNLMDAYLAGNVNIANAVGTGFADDKDVYSYLPAIIKYYLDQDPIIPNVETYSCRDKKVREHVLANLDKLVVKPVGASGGYGVVVGPRANRNELAQLRRQITARPGNFIAQPLVNLSVCPTVVDDGIEPRHVDLRPYVVTGKKTWVLPGGLTRVALNKGSFVVNSSQGGGSKDTWVFAS